MNFKPSDKVVCVYDGPWRGEGPMFGTSVPITEGKVYTIRSVRFDGGVRLIGVILPTCPFIGGETPFWETRFRKLEEIQAEAKLKREKEEAAALKEATQLINSEP